jgi:hypothetical protein
MTVEAQNPDGSPIVLSGPYNGNGVATVFNYDFPVTTAGDIRVTRQNADLTEEDFELTTDYTVTDVGDPGGGTVVLVSGALLPTGSKLVVRLAMDFKQTTAYSNQGRINLELLETSLDRLTLAARQLREETQRAVTVDAFGTTDVAQLRANLNALAAIEADIVTVAGAIAAVNTNAANISDIVTNALNIAAIQTASANAASAAADAAATAADRVQTGLDAAATGADAAQTAGDAVATAADRVQTTADAIQTAADRVQTGLDRVQTGADRVQTGLDRTQTGIDAAAAELAAASLTPATQPQAEAGADNVAYMTSLRTAQAIDARETLTLLSRTVVSGTPAVLDFTFDPGKYDEIRLVMPSILFATDNVGLSMRTSSNGGASFDAGASDYRYIRINLISGGSAVTENATTQFALAAVSVGNDTGEDGCAGVLSLFGVGAERRTRVHSRITGTTNAGTLFDTSLAGERQQSAIVNAIRLFPTVGNFANGGIFTLYGVKSA